MDYEPFFKITYGLYIVSTGDHKVRNGYVANTVFQVTAEPPQLAVSCSKDNHSAALIEKTGVFSVSVMKKDIKPLLFGTFGFRSGKDIDKFEKLNCEAGKTGAPVVKEDCVAWFECRVKQTADLGSHILFVGEVEDYGMIDGSGEPLIYEYYREVKKGKAPKNAPTYVDPTKAK